MRRPFIVALLVFGVIAGFSSGFHHLRERRHAFWQEEEDRLVERCVTQVKSQLAPSSQAASPVPPPAPVPAAPTPTPQVIIVAPQPLYGGAPTVASPPAPAAIPPAGTGR